MARFSVRKLHFGPRPEGDDDHGDNGEGLPTPARVKLAARRVAGIAEAKTVLKHLPGPGESLHCICSARMDLADVIATLGERYGVCERLLIATLGYNERNLQSLLAWLDASAVRELTLLASIFFRAHKGELWVETQREFRSRNQRAACCHSHAKVVTLAFGSGERLTIEGSANLCGNGSGREQICLVNDIGLHAWHSQWITQLVDKHEQQEEDGCA